MTKPQTASPMDELKQVRAFLEDMGDATGDYQYIDGTPLVAKAREMNAILDKLIMEGVRSSQAVSQDSETTKTKDDNLAPSAAPAVDDLQRLRAGLEAIAYIDLPADIPLEAVQWRTTSDQQSDIAVEMIPILDELIAVLEAQAEYQRTGIPNLYTREAPAVDDALVERVKTAIAATMTPIEGNAHLQQAAVYATAATAACRTPNAAPQVDALLKQVYDFYIKECREDNPMTGEIVDRGALPSFTALCEAMAILQILPPAGRGSDV